MYLFEALHIKSEKFHIVDLEIFGKFSCLTLIECGKYVKGTLDLIPELFQVTHLGIVSGFNQFEVL